MGSVGKTVANVATLGGYDYFTGSGSSTDTSQINKPYSDKAMVALTEAQNFGKAGLTGALSGLTAAANDPTAYYNNFMGQAGGLADLVSGSLSPLQQSLSSRASDLAAESTSQAASNLAGLGSLYSGATLKAGADASAKAFADVANQLGSQQISLTGSLWNNALGAAQASESSLRSSQLGALSNVAGAYGNIYGQALQGITGMGVPEYLTTQKTSPWANLFQTGLGAAAGAAAAYGGAKAAG